MIRYKELFKNLIVLHNGKPPYQASAIHVICVEQLAEEGRHRLKE